MLVLLIVPLCGMTLSSASEAFTAESVSVYKALSSVNWELSLIDGQPNAPYLLVERADHLLVPAAWLLRAPLPTLSTPDLDDPDIVVLNPDGSEAPAQRGPAWSVAEPDGVYWPDDLGLPNVLVIDIDETYPRSESA